MATERYIRQLPIVGEDGQQALARKRILIVGCGGLGGNLLENMLRLGVGAITAVDGDRFEASNLNRQLLSTELLLGTGKAEAAAERARAVNSAVEFHPVQAATWYWTGWTTSGTGCCWRRSARSMKSRWSTERSWATSFRSLSCRRAPGCCRCCTETRRQAAPKPASRIPRPAARRSSARRRPSFCWDVSHRCGAN